MLSGGFPGFVFVAYPGDAASKQTGFALATRTRASFPSCSLTEKKKKGGNE